MSGSQSLKISLLTFHRALSYGAVLQTYAMKKALENMGHKVEIIDFQKPFLPKRPTGWWSFKKNYGIDRLRKEYIFHSFRDKYFKSTTKPLRSLESIKKYKFNADVFLVGSDQVWNPRITKESLGIYFFDFVKGKKISYAASFGSETWALSEKETKEVKALLEDFSSISVREQSGQNILSKVFVLKSTTVFDPTLIWADYSALLEPVEYSDYIFCFKVNQSEEFILKAIEIGGLLNKKIILVGDKHKNQHVISIPYPTVEQWISLLYNSSFVFTDSFHGLAFSLNFKKDFLMYNTNPTRFTRISSLLKTLDLENRVFESKLIKEFLHSKIDYQVVLDNLKDSRNKSLNFLKENINR